MGAGPPIQDRPDDAVGKVMTMVVVKIAAGAEFQSDDVPVPSVGSFVFLRVDVSDVSAAEAGTHLGDRTKSQENNNWLLQSADQEKYAEMIAKDLRNAKGRGLLINSALASPFYWRRPDSMPCFV